MHSIHFAQIEPTTRCNYICGFCAGRHMPQRDLAWDDFQAFLAAHPDLRHVELQGEGEPLLHPRFFDMVAACRARDIAVGIITNGSLLTAETAGRLLDAGVRSIHVSMESADPERFQRIRGGRFAKVEAGLRELVSQRAERGLRYPTIGLTVTVLRETIGDMEGIWRLYRDIGLDGGIVAQPLQGMRAYQRHYAPDMARQMLANADMPRFRLLRQTVGRVAPVPEAGGFFYFALFADFDPANGSCPWLERGAYLGSDGAIAGCCFMKESTDSFGHVLADSAAAIAGRRQSLVDELAAGGVPAACDGCSTARAVAAARRAGASVSLAPPEPLPPR